MEKIINAIIETIVSNKINSIFIVVGFIFLVIWFRAQREVIKEYKWMAKIMKENPQLSEDELVEKIKSELLMRGKLRIGQPRSPELEMRLKEQIRKSLNKIRQNLKDY